MPNAATTPRLATPSPVRFGFCFILSASTRLFTSRRTINIIIITSVRGGVGGDQTFKILLPMGGRGNHRSPPPTLPDWWNIKKRFIRIITPGNFTAAYSHLAFAFSRTQRSLFSRVPITAVLIVIIIVITVIIPIKQ